MEILHPVIGVMILFVGMDASALNNVTSSTKGLARIEGPEPVWQGPAQSAAPEKLPGEKGICQDNNPEWCVPVGSSEDVCYSSPTARSWFLVKIQDKLVRCDPSYEGWLVFVKRQDGSQNFIRTWAEYRNGFGDVSREFWLGNEMLHQITKQGVYKLRVEMEDWDGMKYWAEYNNFYVGPASDRYRLTVGGYNTESNAGDAMNDPSEDGRFVANGMFFSTIDVDNDNKESGNCADYGGWWHNSCKYAFPTGTYLKPGTESAEGIKWSPVKGNLHTLKAMEFKIRPLY